MPTPEEYLKKKRKELLGGPKQPTAGYSDDYYRPYERLQQPVESYRDRARMPKIRPEQAYTRAGQTQARRPLDIPEQAHRPMFPSQSTTAQMQPARVQPYATGQESEEERLKRLLQMTRYGTY